MGERRVTIGFYPRERFALAGKALSAIVRHTKAPYTLVVVDGGTPERYLREMESAVAGLTEVRWIRSEGFLTPAAAANKVVSATDDEFVCLIENDNLVQEGWLERMLETAEGMPADAVIPLIYEGPTWRRKVHHDRGFPGLAYADGEGGRVMEVVGDAAELAGRHRETEPKRVTSIEAHCVLFRRAALEAMGPFDEGLLANEGADNSFRLFHRGLVAAIDPRAVVNHYPPVWIRADEREYFQWRWDYRRAEEGERRFLARWPATRFPDGLDFVRGQRYRTNPFSYTAYRIFRTPDRLRWILQTDQFMRHSALFFVLSMTAAALSYLFHPVLARLLSVEDYGEVSALLSLYGTVAIPVGVFGTIVVNVVANADEHDHHDTLARRRLISALRKLASVVVAVVVAGTALSAPLLGRFFQFRSVGSLLAFAGTFLCGAAIIFRRAYLRGTKQFGALGISQIVETGMRLALAAAFAYFGWRAAGAMFAVVLAQACVLLYVLRRTRADFSYVPVKVGELRPEIRGEMRYAGLILCNSLVVAALTLSDVLVVKHYFPPTDAGMYGGIATVARIVAYVTGAVTGVLVPSVRLKNSRSENGSVLRKALLLNALLGGVTLAAFAVVPTLVIRLLIGGRYLGFSPLLPALSFQMFLVALLSPLFSYYLALRRREAAVMGGAAAVVILLLCAVRHATPVQVVHNFIFGLAALLIAFAAKASIDNRKHHADVRA